MTSVDFEVRVENIYADLDDEGDFPDAMKIEYPENVKQTRVESDDNSVTVTLEMTIDSDNLPSFFADEDEWNEWGEECVFPHTGTGRTDGDAGYFAEITAVTSTHPDDEYDYIVGKSWEWGT